MCSCYAQSFVLLGQHAQHLCTLFDVETVTYEVFTLRVGLGYGRRIYYEGVCRVTTFFGNEVNIILVMDMHTLFDKLFRQF